MSLHYLLDGYNILKQMAAFRELPLEEGRKAFLRWIDDQHPQGSANNTVTVVFDGHPDYFGTMQQGDIRVIFSEGCSADDTIKRMVDEDRNLKNCVVVSDDKDVFLYARSQGARAVKVAAFIAKPAAPHGRVESGGKYISLSRQEKINQELKRKWLGENL